jgi:hypothetical protein
LPGSGYLEVGEARVNVGDFLGGIRQLAGKPAFTTTHLKHIFAGHMTGTEDITGFTPFRISFGCHRQTILLVYEFLLIIFNLLPSW